MKSYVSSFSGSWLQRCLSMVLCFCMVLSLCPLPQHAAASEVEEGQEVFQPVETQPAPQPVEAQPAPQPVETQPAPQPEETQPVTVPEETQPVTVPEETQPVTVPEQTQPVTEPEQTQPVTEPEQTQPVTVPEETQTVTVPEETQEVTEPEETQEVTEPEETQETTEPEETQEEQPLVVTAWQWNDELEALDEETGILGVSFASIENPVYLWSILEVLPAEIYATVDGEVVTLTLGEWKCDDYPTAGAYQGEYVFKTTLPEGYVLAEDAAALEVPVVFYSDASTLEEEHTHSFDASGVCECGAMQVRYLDASHAVQTAVCQAVTAETTELTDGWYVAQGNVTIGGSVTATENANLILADGCSLTVSGDFLIQGGKSLNIYVQSLGTGSLTIAGSTGLGVSGSGNVSVGIYGGRIVVTSIGSNEETMTLSSSAGSSAVIYCGGFGYQVDRSGFHGVFVSPAEYGEIWVAGSSAPCCDIVIPQGSEYYMYFEGDASLSFTNGRMLQVPDGSSLQLSGTCSFPNGIAANVDLRTILSYGYAFQNSSGIIKLLGETSLSGSITLVDKHYCSWQYKDSTAEGHTRYCDECGRSFIEPHRGDMEQGMEKTDINHTYTCDCGAEVTEAHQWEYFYSDANQHEKYCPVCGKSEDIPHDFTSGDCVCGAVQVSYADATGAEQGTAGCIRLNSIDEEEFRNSRLSGWYLVENEAACDVIGTEGSINLILANGCSLNIDSIYNGGKMTIWQQTAEAGKATGKLVLSGPDFAIGGSYVTIKGGVLELSGTEHAFEYAPTLGSGMKLSEKDESGNFVPVSIADRTSKLSTAQSLRLEPCTPHEWGTSEEEYIDSSYHGVRCQYCGIGGDRKEAHSFDADGFCSCGAVQFLDASGNQAVQYCQVLSGETTYYGDISSGWYVVKGDFDFQGTMSGTVNLVLANGSKLYNSGDAWDHKIQLDENANLTVYAQSTDPSVMGKLVSTYTSQYGLRASSITINGGNIYVAGMDWAVSGRFAVNGGIVELRATNDIGDVSYGMPSVPVGMRITIVKDEGNVLVTDREGDWSKQQHVIIQPCTDHSVTKGSTYIDDNTHTLMCAYCDVLLEGTGEHDFGTNGVCNCGLVQYLDENGVTKTQLCQKFTGGMENGGWYVLDKDYSGWGFWTEKDANLILAKGVTLNSDVTLYGCTLTVYGQPGSVLNLGNLDTEGDSGSSLSILGGVTQISTVNNYQPLTLTVNGGILSVDSVSEPDNLTVNNLRGIYLESGAGQVAGDFTLSQSFELYEDEILTIPEGAKLTTGGKLVNNGAVFVDGELTDWYICTGEVYYPVKLPEGVTAQIKTDEGTMEDLRENDGKLYAKAEQEIVLTNNGEGTILVNENIYENSFFMPSRTVTVKTHLFDSDGFCTECGAYQPATKNNGKYEIGNAGQLFWFAGVVNGTLDWSIWDTQEEGVLTADIVIPDGKTWTPIGSNQIRYQGTFDGRYHKISNLRIEAPEGFSIGLFGASTGTIKCLTVENVSCGSVSGNYAGGICGMNYGTIRSCFADSVAWTNVGNTHVGSVCGYNGRAMGRIMDCRSANSTMQKTAASAAEELPLCGYNANSISGCTSDSGICLISDDGTISDCLSSGSYLCQNLRDGTIKDCYTTGSAFVLSKEGGTIDNCYYQAASETFNDNGSVGKTTAQFASGEVAYLLNGDRTVDGNPVWGQTLTGENPQAYPVLGGDQVAAVTKCDGTDEVVGYYNGTSPTVDDHDFTDNDGFCTGCDTYEKPNQDENNVYLIDNAGKLFWFADFCNSNDAPRSAKLLNSIDIPKKADGSKREWTPIGTSSLPYTGTFDGQGFTISGLYFNDSAVSYVGLFGCAKIVGSGIIQNVIVEGSFTGKYRVGGICGYLQSGTIRNCQNQASVNAEQTPGGICGRSDGTIEHCHNSGTITASPNSGNGAYAGGICGMLSSGATIGYCSNSGIVTGTGYCVGGIAGSNTTSWYGQLTDCWNSGSIGGGNTTDVGGIIGGQSNSPGTVANCYSYGTVSTANNYGPICSYSYSTPTNCFYQSNTETDSFGGTTAKTAEEFASGEVAYLLNDGRTPAVWGQNLAEGSADAYPVLNGEPVAQVKDCAGTVKSYTNADSEVTLPHEVDETGKCSICNTQFPVSATIDGVTSYYETFLEASTQVYLSGNGTLTLLAEEVNTAVPDGSLFISGTFNLDLNGKTLNVDTSVYVEDGENSEAELNVLGGAGSKLILAEGEKLYVESGKANIQSGEITGDIRADGGALTITGGKFTGKIEVYNSATYSITGGEFVNLSNVPGSASSNMQLYQLPAEGYWFYSTRTGEEGNYTYSDPVQFGDITSFEYSYNGSLYVGRHSHEIVFTSIDKLDHNGSCQGCGKTYFDHHSGLDDGFCDICGAGEISYVDAQGNDMGKQLCIAITEDTTELSESPLAWYVVKDPQVDISERITVNGNVNLILAENCTLNATSGIDASGSGSSITIWAQSVAQSADGTTGKLNATDARNDYAGIAGTVTINGGIITANGGLQAAGIGGNRQKGAAVTINGGFVSATSGKYGAGIGNGNMVDDNTVTNVTINGGTVEARSEYGAGIGTGNTFKGTVNVTISGGTVTASSSKNYGIHANSVGIFGGTVTASGRSGFTVAPTIDPSYGYYKVSASDSVDDLEAVASGSRDDTYTARKAVKIEPCESHEADSYTEITVDTHSGTCKWCDSAFTENHTEGDICTICGAGEVSYVDAQGNSYNEMCIAITADTTELTTSPLAWYVVKDAGLLVGNRITVKGSVNLILMDGKDLTVNGGIRVGNGQSLTIWSQTNGSGTLNATGSSQSAGIGGNGHEGVGTIVINGGTVNAQGGNNGAGIGGGGVDSGTAGSGGTVTINGGVVTATGSSGAGIGGGYAIDGNGGAGGSVTINGGTVTATGVGYASAGIGGGGGGIHSGWHTGGAGAVVKINGGTVYATGGYSVVTGYAPGIGGGVGNTQGGAGGSLTVTGGYVVATGIGGAASNVNNNPGANGSFMASGNGVVITDNIKDQTQIGNWNGIVFIANEGKVYGDVTLSSNLTIPAGKAMTLNMNGKSLTLDGSAVISLGENSSLKLSGNGSFPNSVSILGGYLLDILDDGWAFFYDVEGNDIVSLRSDTRFIVDDPSEPTVYLRPHVHSWVITGFDQYSHAKTCTCMTGSVEENHTEGDFCDICGAGMVSYLDETEELQRQLCIALTDSSTTLGTAGKETWYVVKDYPVEISDRIELSGDVNLILADGCLLKVNKGIHVPEGSSLTIWCQSGKTGALAATGADGAGIGGNENNYKPDVDSTTGSITINGGNITAYGGWGDAAIGGAFNGSSGSVTINGGSVNAFGGGPAAETNRWGGAGIGGGLYCGAGTIQINGGTVYAVGAEAAAGIGGGSGYGGSVEITGGHVTAIGGSENTSYSFGLNGIGSGGSDDIPVTIKGGTVICVAGNTTEGYAGKAYKSAPTIDSGYGSYKVTVAGTLEGLADGSPVDCASRTGAFTGNAAVKLEPCKSHSRSCEDKEDGIQHVHLCQYCGKVEGTEKHTAPDEDGRCTACGALIVASVTGNDFGPLYCSDFSVACEAAYEIDGSTLTLLQDVDISISGVSYSSYIDKRMTLDLNGKNLKLGGITFIIREYAGNYGNLTVTGDGMLSLNEPVTVNDGCTLTIEGGTIAAAIHVSDAGTLNITGGSFEKANGFGITNSDSISITGGEFIQNALSTSYYLKSLLGKDENGDYAYWYYQERTETDSGYSYSDPISLAEAEQTSNSVKLYVGSHEHAYVNDGTCVCGKMRPVKMSVDGEYVEYFDSLDAALEFLESNPVTAKGEITLRDDVSCNGDLVIPEKVTLEVNSGVELDADAVYVRGELTNNGTITGSVYYLLELTDCEAACENDGIVKYDNSTYARKDTVIELTPVVPEGKMFVGWSSDHAYIVENRFTMPPQTTYVKANLPTIVATVTIGDQPTPYTNLYDAFAAANGAEDGGSKVIIELKADAKLDRGTIQLDNRYCNVIFRGGSYKIYGEEPGDWEYRNGYIGVLSGADLTIESGTIDSSAFLHCGSGSSVTVTNGSIHTLIVEGGKLTVEPAVDEENNPVGNIRVENLEVKPFSVGDIQLKGGSYGTITVPGGKYVSDLLAEGYAYKLTDGSWEDANNGTYTEAITEATVVPVPVTITAQPDATKTMTYGDVESLSVTANREDASYQWYEVIPDTSETAQAKAITGATNSTLKLSTFNAGTHEFFCKATVDGYNAVSSSATVTVNPRTLDIQWDDWDDGTFEYDGQNHPKFTIGNTANGDQVFPVLQSGNEPQKNVGSYTVGVIDFVANGTDGFSKHGNYKLGATYRDFSITAKPITVNITANGGTYGGAITGATAELVGVVAGETVPVTLTYTNGADYDSTDVPKDAGTYTVTASISASNYELTGTTTAKFVVNQATNSWTDEPSVSNWTYGDSSTVNPGEASFGTVQVTYYKGETKLTAAPTNAGSYKVCFDVEGTSNYSALHEEKTFTIEKRQLSIASAEGYERSYDGTNAFSVLEFTYENMIEGDQVHIGTPDAGHLVTVSSANVGTYDKATLPAGLTLTGTDAGNYSLVQPTGPVATVMTINPREVTFSGITPYDKDYDGTKDVTNLEYSGLQISGLIDGDDLSVSVTAAFTDANAGQNKTVAFTNPVLTGNSAGNYVLKETGNQTSTTATIYPLEISIVGVTVEGKVYDGTKDAPITNFGRLSTNYDGENLTIVPGTASFETANAGNGKTVSFQGFELDGSAKGNYQLSGQPASTTANITPATVATLTLKASSATYDGNAKVPVIVAVTSENDLTLTGSDYEVSYQDASGSTVTELRNAGEYTVTVTGKGNFQGTATASYTIEKANAATGTAPKANSLTYNGQAQELVTAGTTTDGTMVYSTSEDGEYTTTIPTGKDAGGYEVWYMVQGDSNHLSSAPVKLTPSIAQKSIAGATITLDAVLTYNGEEQTQSITSVEVDGLTVTYEVSGNTGTNAGNYKLTVTGNGNFTGTKDMAWSIAKKSIADAEITLGDELTYNGKLQTQSIASVKVGGLEVTYTVSKNTGTNAGEYTLTVTANGNFIGTKDMAWSIAKKSIADAEITLGAQLTYNGNPQRQSITSVKIDGLNVTYDASGVENTNAGSYTLTVTGNGNFQGEATASYSIAKAKPTVTPATLTITYGTKLSGCDLSGFKASFGGKELPGSFAFDQPETMPHVSDSGATSYKLTFTPEDTVNFEKVPLETKVTVNKKELTVDVAVQDKQYNGTSEALFDGTPALVGVVTGDKVELTYGNPYFTDVAEKKDIAISFTEAFGIQGDDSGNYYLTQPTGITASIYNSFTAAKGEDGSYTVSTNEWTNQDFVVTAQEGLQLSLTNTADGSWFDTLTVTTEGEADLKFYVRSADGAISKQASEHYKLDKTAPTGSIFFDGTDQMALTPVVLYRNVAVNAEITGSDDRSGVKDLAWAATKQAQEPSSITEWNTTDSFQLTPEDGTERHVYLKVVDNAGNVAYFRANTILFDTTKPSITGVKNGATYYTTQTAAVSDDYLDAVTLNGAAVTLNEDGKTASVKLTGNVEKTYILKATDKAGNETTVTVIMKPISSITDPVKDLTKDNVTEDDRKTLDELTGILEDLLEPTTDQTEKQKLQDELDKLEELLDVLDEVKEVEELLRDLPDDVEPDVDADTEQKIKDARKALDDLTDHQEDLVEDDLIEKLERLEKELVDYKIEGGSTWNRGSGKALRLVGNGRLDKLDKVILDGTELTTGFTKSTPKTTIDLQAAFLQSLELGEHTLKLVYTDGEAEAKFTVKQSPNYLDLTGNPDFDDQTEVDVGGERYPIEEIGGRYVNLPESGDLLTTYTYLAGNAAGTHDNYPIGMRVFRINRSEDGTTVTEITEFADLLQYSGCSIRVSGKRGIRMITSMTKANKSALKGKGLAGFTMLEYGTVVQWADTLGSDDLTLNSGNHNYAYKRGVADPVFGTSGGLTQYTNVLVGFDLEECSKDIVMRPYIILQDADGNQYTLYGGLVTRSISYIAWQNRDTYKPGTAAYKYVHELMGDLDTPAEGG